MSKITAEQRAAIVGLAGEFFGNPANSKEDSTRGILADMLRDADMDNLADEVASAKNLYDVCRKVVGEVTEDAIPLKNFADVVLPKHIWDMFGMVTIYIGSRGYYAVLKDDQKAGHAFLVAYARGLRGLDLIGAVIEIYHGIRQAK